MPIMYQPLSAAWAASRNWECI